MDKKLKPYQEFPYVNLRRIAFSTLTVIFVAVFTYFITQNSNDADVRKLAMILPIITVYYILARYLTFGLWYINKIRNTGIAYTDLGRRNRAFDPTCMYGPELMKYNVTYDNYRSGKSILSRYGLFLVVNFGILLSMLLPLAFITAIAK